MTSAGDVVLPALLRAARTTYRVAIRQSLADAGIDDMPRNGPFVIGGMGNRGGSASDLIRSLQITKQAASQLIDTLVLRGYLDRQPDPEDRRRTTLALTDRGRHAAAAVRAGVEYVDAQLAARCSPDQIEALRAGLFALIEIRDGGESGERAP